MRRPVLAFLAVAMFAALPASAGAAKRCGNIDQKPKGYGAGVVYLARSITTTGGVSCRKGREVVRAFLSRGISPDDARTVRGYVCTVPYEPSARAECRSVASSRRAIRFAFDLVGGN